MPEPQHMNDFPWPSPANLRPSDQPPPTAKVVDPAPTVRALPRLAGWEMFRLDSDLKPALEVMCGPSGHDWQRWLEQMINDALRHYLGR